MQEETVVRQQHRKTIILETLHIPSLGYLPSLSLSCCQETIMQGLQKSILMHHYLEKDERIHYFSHIQKKKQKQKTTKTTILEDINCNCLIELYLSFLVALLNRNAAQKHTTDLKKNIMEYYKFYWTPENIYIENSEDLRVQSSRSFASKSTDLFIFYFREG